MEPPKDTVRIRDIQYSRWENGCWITSYQVYQVASALVVEFR